MSQAVTTEIQCSRRDGGRARRRPRSLQAGPGNQLARLDVVLSFEFAHYRGVWRYVLLPVYGVCPVGAVSKKYMLVCLSAYLLLLFIPGRANPRGMSHPRRERISPRTATRDSDLRSA